MKFRASDVLLGRKNWPKKVLAVAALLATVFTFGRILKHQKESNDARGEVARLKESKEIIPISNWEGILYFCYYPKGETATNLCFEDPLRKKDKFNLPLVKFENPTLNFAVNEKNESKPANTVWLQRELSAEEKELIKTSKDWMLIIPRQIHRATFLGENMPAPVASFGKAADVSFGLSQEVLLKTGRLDLVVNYRQLPSFGPLELEPVLAKPEAAMQYMSVFSKQVGAALLSKQLLVGLPLVICAIAIVLDQSLAMLFLAAFGALRAIHSYFAFRSETELLSLTDNLINYSALGASLALLLIFFETTLGSPFKKIRAWHRFTFVILAAIFAVGGHFLIKDWQLTSTLWVDSISAGLGIILMAVVGVFNLRKKKKTPSQQNVAEEKNQFNVALSNTLKVVQWTLMLSTLVVSGSVNVSELQDLLNGTAAFTDPLDWRHLMLMPALLTAGLLEVGSMAKRMQTFGQEMAHAALIEKDMKIGHDVQGRMLPDKKHQDPLWKWHSVYHPAEALAGDWYDIREVTFADGRKLLAVCLADVTGHGVGSSLSTSVICSHWSLWCKALAQGEFPADKKAREEVLASAPLHVHNGLCALRKNENCTAMMALVDPYLNEVSITSAGHPGALLINEKGLRYVTTPGERLGGELMGEAKWTAKTESFTDTDLLAIYSDGIVPVGATVLGWAGQLKKKILGHEGKPELMLMNTLHANKRAFMNDPVNEDDMTLILLRRGHAMDEQIAQLH